MESSDLRFFEAVARLGVMTRAAAELYTVQSNVTARIRALEQNLGASLFDRHSSGVTLTDAGRRLLPYARRVSLLLDEAARAVSDDGTPQGTLTIGLKYGPDKAPAISELKRVSRPGRRVYVSVTDIPRVKNGLGVAVLSTSKGVVVDREARKNRLGGELLCTVW